MSARKTGLPEYAGDITVYAAKITDIVQEPGGPRLVFGDIGRSAGVMQLWCNEKRPAVGGYFVVFDLDGGKQAIHMPADEFESSYKKVVPA